MVRVTTGAQPGDPVVNFAKRRQDQHRRRVASGPQTGDDRQAVAARQHAVDDHHVIVAGVSEGEAGFAVAGDMGGVSGLGEGFLEVIGRFAIVFYDENLHGTVIRDFAGRLSGRHMHHGLTRAYREQSDSRIRSKSLFWNVVGPRATGTLGSSPRTSFWATCTVRAATGDGSPPPLGRNTMTD
jgi:hypothetical protein